MPFLRIILTLSPTAISGYTRDFFACKDIFNLTSNSFSGFFASDGVNLVVESSAVHHLGMSVAAHPANSFGKPPPRPKGCKMREPRPSCLRRLHHTPDHTFAPEPSLSPHCAPRPSTALNSAAGQRTVRFALRNARSRRNGKEAHSAEHEHCARQTLLQQKS